METGMFYGKKRYLLMAAVLILALAVGGIILFGGGKTETKMEYDGIFVQEEMGLRL